MATTASIQGNHPLRPDQTANRPDVPRPDLIAGLGPAGCCKTTISKGQQLYLWRVFKHTSRQKVSLVKCQCNIVLNLYPPNGQHHFIRNLFVICSSFRRSVPLRALTVACLLAPVRQESPVHPSKGKWSAPSQSTTLGSDTLLFVPVSGSGGHTDIKNLDFIS